MSSVSLLDIFEEPLPEPAARYGFLVTGPNASGKTSAVTDALKEWVGDRRVAAAYADNSNRGTFKGDGPTMVASVRRIWADRAPVVVIEGTNRIALKLAQVIQAEPELRTCEALMTLAEPEVMQQMIRARCERLGKRFRDDYWTLRVCKGEGQGRYRSLGRRLFPGTRYFNVGPDYAAAGELRDYLRDRVTACLAR